MNKYINFISNFSTLYPYYIINKKCNSYFKPQNISKNVWVKISYFGINYTHFVIKYFEYFNAETILFGISSENLINVLFDKLIKNNITIRNEIFFNISKTQEEKELFLQKLLDNDLFGCPYQYCFQIYQLSEQFFINNINKFNRINDFKNFEKSKNNLSNKFILNNIDKIPINYFFEDKTRFFSQDEISQILDFSIEFPDLRIYITSRLLNSLNLEKVINIINNYIKTSFNHFNTKQEKNLHHFNYILEELYGKSILNTIT